MVFSLSFKTEGRVDSKLILEFDGIKYESNTYFMCSNKSCLDIDNKLVVKSDKTIVVDINTSECTYFSEIINICPPNLNKIIEYAKLFKKSNITEYNLLCKYCEIQGTSFAAVFQYLLLGDVDVSIIYMFINFSMNDILVMRDIDFGKYNLYMLTNCINRCVLDKPLFDRLCEHLQYEERNNLNICLGSYIKNIINCEGYLAPAGYQKLEFLSSYYRT